MMLTPGFMVTLLRVLFHDVNPGFYGYLHVPYRTYQSIPAFVGCFCYSWQLIHFNLLLLSEQVNNVHTIVKIHKMLSAFQTVCPYNEPVIPVSMAYEGEFTFPLSHGGVLCFIIKPYGKWM